MQSLRIRNRTVLAVVSVKQPGIEDCADGKVGQRRCVRT